MCARLSVLDQRSTTRISCASPTIEVVRSTCTGTRSKLVQIQGSGGNELSVAHFTDWARVGDGDVPRVLIELHRRLRQCREAGSGPDGRSRRRCRQRPGV